MELGLTGLLEPTGQTLRTMINRHAGTVELGPSAVAISTAAGVQPKRPMLFLKPNSDLSHYLAVLPSTLH